MRRKPVLLLCDSHHPLSLTHTTHAALHMHRDPAKLQAQASANGGSVKAVVNGQPVVLTLGTHFAIGASSLAQRQ